MSLYTTDNPPYDLSKEHIGGKAYGLYRMRQIGLRVPEWICVPCATSLNPPTSEYEQEVFFYNLLSTVRYRFPSSDIFSVRSGAPISMPGMMDTLLNVGIDHTNIDLLKSKFGDNQFYNIYARLIRQYSEFEGMDPEPFQKAEEDFNVFYGIGDTKKYLNLYLNYRKIRGSEMPTREEQLKQAVQWVWESYHSDRAKTYRKIQGIPDSIGTGVLIQRMVFGNLNETSGTGVAFSHHPNSGKKGLVGDFLAMGQGEEVVSGTANTQQIVEAAETPEFQSAITELQKAFPRIRHHLDLDILDVEFTIENGVLYFLQVREAKVSTKAKVSVVIEEANPEKKVDLILDLISQKAKQMSAGPKADETLSAGQVLMGTGKGAVEGQVVGRIATTHEQANIFAAEGTPFIFAAEMTSPNDTEPMSKSIGILTKVGGSLSHAAIIAREWGKVAVVAFSGMEIESPTTIKVNGESLSVITLQVDGQKGKVLV